MDERKIMNKKLFTTPEQRAIWRKVGSADMSNLVEDVDTTIAVRDAALALLQEAVEQNASTYFPRLWLQRAKELLAPTVEKEGGCGCGKDGEPPHPCPYSEEIHGDSETLCTCCDDCQYQCAMAI